MTAPTSSSTAETVDAATEPLTTQQAATPEATGAGRLEQRPGRPYRRSWGTDPVVWVCALFVLNFLVQRISVPGIDITMSVPVTALWLLLAWSRGILVIEHRRLLLWLLAAGCAALVVLPQLLFVRMPYISVNSWAFWMVIWLPVCFVIAERSRATFERTLRAVTDIGVGLGIISAMFVLVQVAGVPYRDVLGDALPPSLLVTGFNTSYPFTYESELFKSNGWLALEPSFMSFTLGLCIIAGLLTQARTWKIVVMGLGMMATLGGSGFALVLVAVVVMLVNGQHRLLKRYVVPGIVVAAIAIPTTVGQLLLERLTEGQDQGSSASLRSVEPYMYLWPRWIEDPAQVLFGGGAGSSAEAVDGAGIAGLLVPTTAKVLYDYGLIAGTLLFVLFLSCYVRSPEPALGISVLVSMLIVQPPAQPLMVPAFLLITLWAPAPLGNRLAGTDPADIEAARPRRRRRVRPRAR